MLAVRQRYGRQRTLLWLISVIRTATVVATLGAGMPCFAVERELGVGLHVGLGRPGHENALGDIVTSGLTSFRDEIFWQDVEAMSGQYLLSGKARRSFDNFSTAHRIGMNPILILDYGNPVYGGGQPDSDQPRKAFAAYASALLARFDFDMPYVEIWNEWNIGAGSIGGARHGSATGYVKLVDAVVPEIRKKHPETKILVGALGDDLNGWPWLSKAIDAGLLRSVDGVSIHLYNHSNRPPGGGAAEMFERLLSLQDLLRARTKGIGVPIYVTEVGYPNHDAGLSEQDASEQLSAFLFLAMSIADLKGIWLYEWMDGGLDKTDREHNFGLRRVDGTEKPLGCRIRQYGDVLRSGKVVSNYADAQVTAVLVDADGAQYFVAVPKYFGRFDAPPNTVEISGQDLRVGKKSIVRCGDALEEHGGIVRTAGGFLVKLRGKPVIIRMEGKVERIRGAVAPVLRR